MPFFQHTLTVRFRDCDMFQHVNNAVYFTYFEEARAAYWRALLGPDFAGFDFLIAEATCSYRSPALYDETLRIDVRVTRIGTKSFDIAYRIDSMADGREIATGRTVQVRYDHAAKASIPVSDELRRRIEAFEAMAVR